jgi:hypothetical protein
MQFLKNLNNVTSNSISIYAAPLKTLNMFLVKKIAI